jgi:hypothetical protein
MSEINLEAVCQLFETQVTLQYQNRLKLQETIEERYGLRGPHLNHSHVGSQYQCSKNSQFKVKDQ